MYILRQQKDTYAYYLWRKRYTFLWCVCALSSDFAIADLQVKF